MWKFSVQEKLEIVLRYLEGTDGAPSYMKNVELKGFEQKGLFLIHQSLN
ncbi:hypothetical protein J2T13_005174 [Paenibacillus sp. DS2015]